MKTTKITYKNRNKTNSYQEAEDKKKQWEDQEFNHGKYNTI
jgi:hypothetical protein